MDIYQRNEYRIPEVERAMKIKKYIYLNSTKSDVRIKTNDKNCKLILRVNSEHLLSQ